jgi:hypothetical protein
VAGGERGSFVEEEQLGITSLGHHFPIAAFEIENARDPAPAFVAAHNFPIARVKRTTPIAHHRAAGRRPKNSAEWIDAVL